MKKMLAVSIAMMFLAVTAFAAPFAPTLLKISSQANVYYQFDNSSVTIPVTITGTPANVTFLVYTTGKASVVSAVQNGYLGWHYVNKIDTCVFYSDPLEMTKGSNSIVWDGKNNDGKAVSAGVYTYYLFGFDNQTPKVEATNFLQSRAHDSFLRFQEVGTDGKPLSNPLVYNSRYFQKWTLGGDPNEAALVETTAVTIPASFGGQAMMPILNPTNFSQIFIEVGNTDTATQGICKYNWVPNGDATLVSEWADNGVSTTGARWGGGNADAGVDTDGNYLYTVTGIHYITDAEADLRAWDINDGTVIQRFDMTPWWSSVVAVEAGGQMNGGPNTLYMRGGDIFLSCHCSCLKQMVNPTLGMLNGDDLVVWSNGNGDYTMDHNFEETAEKKWLCNDYNVGPYTYTLQSDANKFSLAPSYDMGAVSFGLLAPDGTGLGYRAFAGETADLKFGQYMVDNGGSFDGLYSDNNTGSSGNVGLWFTGQDSFKGTISDQVAVADAAPAAFAVAQNSPNPFNPTTTISFTLAKAGKTTVDVYNVAGQKISTLVNSSLSAGSHSVTWNAAKFSAGVYFYTVKSGDFSKTMKMTLLK